MSQSMPDAPGERLQKVLARAGLGSRRACEELIVQGRVQVAGRSITELGTRVDPATQEIRVDGERIRLEKPVYYLLNKPRGVLCTNYDPDGRARVIDLVPEIAQRVFTVGRLDEDSEGLLLLTNDGELANRLTHPRYGVPKTYRVQVAGHPTADDLEQMARGIWLAEGRARAQRVRRVGSQGHSTVLEVVLAEGHNREIRRMFARLGHKVLRLQRTAIATLSDRALRPGQYRKLTGPERDELRELAYAKPEPSSRPRRRRARPTAVSRAGGRRPRPFPRTRS